MKFNISKNSLTHLLHILKAFHPELPLCASTLLKDYSEKKDVWSVEGGEFVYFGIMDSLKQRISSGLCRRVKGSRYSQLVMRHYQRNCCP